jgi:hypothetical protein
VLTIVPAGCWWLGQGYHVAYRALNSPRARQRAQRRTTTLLVGSLILIMGRAIDPKPNWRVQIVTLYFLGVAKSWTLGRQMLRRLRLTPQPPRPGLAQPS